MYISSKNIKKAFEQLKFTRNANGKLGLERTSSLMYFFAFDIVAKQQNVDVIDIDLSSLSGKNTRAAFVLAYSKLVTIKNTTNGCPQHIASLGEVRVGGKTPDKKMASNFLSVPIVKASIAKNIYEYPSRPAPLMYFGQCATEKPFGITYHKNWIQNINSFFVDMKSRSPYTDIAIFICRNEQFIDNGENERDALYGVIRNKFSSALTEFFISKLENEKLFSQHIEWNNFFSEQYGDALADNVAPSRKKELENLSKKELIDIILTLENKP